MILAKNTKPGAVYRRTKSPPPGSYYMRPRPTKRNTPRAWVTRQVDKGKAVAWHWFHQLRLCPELVLLVFYTRGIDPFTGKKFEVSRYVLVPPTTHFREVRSKPGYTR